MTKRLLTASLTAVLLGGCAGVPRGNNLPSGYKMPPPPPKRVDMPIDAGLRREAEAELAKNLNSGDAVLRANAIEAMQRTGGANNAPRLLAALTDPNPLVRFAGGMAIGTLRLEAARPRLLTMADDSNKSVQIAVRFALHRLGDTRLSHEFEIFAKDIDDRVRSNTALALGLLGEPSATNVLRVMQRDLNPIVRLQVIDSLWRLGDTAARDKLVTGVVDVHPEVQIVSLLGLAGPRKPEVLRYVRAQLTAEGTETRLAAARAAGQLGTDDGMAVVLKEIDSRDPRQRSMAALALGDIGRTDAQPPLRKLLNDREPGVRLAAATAVLQLK
jgi:HEAT repeat protein